MRRLTFNPIEGTFDFIDIEDVNILQDKILSSILIEVDYTDNDAPKSCVLTDEEQVLYDEIENE